MSYKVMQDAKLHPRDEYYTLMEDIVAEISSYPASVFKGKIVYCNCDGPTSNFYKFFKANFAMKDWEKDFKVVGSVKPHIRGKATFHRILIQRK